MYKYNFILLVVICLSVSSKKDYFESVLKRTRIIQQEGVMACEKLIHDVNFKSPICKDEREYYQIDFLGEYHNSRYVLYKLEENNFTMSRIEYQVLNNTKKLLKELGNIVKKAEEEVLLPKAKVLLQQLNILDKTFRLNERFGTLPPTVFEDRANRNKLVNLTGFIPHRTQVKFAYNSSYSFT
uniref:Uncharacterized protein n=1 Tax=Clastoptera arizonana TaxID=38151 RepID=A0A1B6CDR6_9HEMI